MPRVAPELTAQEVRRLSHPGGQRNALFAVGGVPGLHIQVTPKGGRSWVLRAKVGKLRRDIGLGGFPAVTLSQAREKALIQAIAELASHNHVLDVSVQHPRSYPSKYEEAQALAMEYPEIEGYLPKRRRRIFDFEPRSMVLFEALALANEVIKGPPTRLAAAMG
ncbi:MAG: Arm DNA-binding domain-containing protein [Pseudomonadota bacterium]